MKVKLLVTKNRVPIAVYCCVKTRYGSFVNPYLISVRVFQVLIFTTFEIYTNAYFKKLLVEGGTSESIQSDCLRETTLRPFRENLRTFGINLRLF